MCSRSKRQPCRSCASPSSATPWLIVLEQVWDRRDSPGVALVNDSRAHLHYPNSDRETRVALSCGQRKDDTVVAFGSHPTATSLTIAQSTSRHLVLRVDGEFCPRDQVSTTLSHCLSHEDVCVDVSHQVAWNHSSPISVLANRLPAVTHW